MVIDLRVPKDVAKLLNRCTSGDISEGYSSMELVIPQLLTQLNLTA
jgi:hypothetical protein